MEADNGCIQQMAESEYAERLGMFEFDQVALATDAEYLGLLDAAAKLQEILRKGVWK